jgi:tetratricopeptide (TPR) repeat protein
MKRYKDAEKYYLLAIDKGDHVEETDLNVSNDKQEEYIGQKKYYQMAIDNGNALNNLAVLYQNQERFTEAENYYLMAIKNDDAKALNNLSYLYYQTGKSKAKALGYINKACSLGNDPTTKETQLTIELWNGIFDNVENRIMVIVREKDGEYLEEFIIDLLVQQQKALVMRLFQSEEFGAKLRERYMVLHYVALLLNNPQDGNLKLRIPPELQATIDDVLRMIKAQQQFYFTNKSLIH